MDTFVAHKDVGEGKVQNKRYVVRLTDQERRELLDMVFNGKAAAYKIKHANILQNVDADGPRWTDPPAGASTQLRNVLVMHRLVRYSDIEKMGQAGISSSHGFGSPP